MNSKKTVWGSEQKELFEAFKCTDKGLSGTEAAERLAKNGPNELTSGKKKRTFVNVL